MKDFDSGRRWNSILLMLLLSSSLALTMSQSALGDPTLVGNEKYRTIVWDFNDSAFYQAENATILDGKGRLSSSSAAIMLNGSSFGSNMLSFDRVTLDVSGLKLQGDESNYMANGDFSTGANWSFSSGSSGNLNVSWSSDGVARWSVSSPTSPYPWRDSMSNPNQWDMWANDTSLLSRGTTNESVDGDGAMQFSAWPISNSSLIRFSRSISGWDFSKYNRLSLWIRLANGTASLSFSVSLFDGSREWISSPSHPVATWQRLNISLDASAVNLSVLQDVRLRFTNTSSQMNVLVDDLRFENVKRFSDMALVSQEIYKDFVTVEEPGRVMLAGDISAKSLFNVTLAIFQVNVTGVASSFQASYNLSHTEQQSFLLDLSTAMASQGRYNFSFYLFVSVDTAENATLTVNFDNVILKMPGYMPGYYLSKALAPVGGKSVLWGNMTWNASVPAGTSIIVMVRSGNSTFPDSTWSGWENYTTAGSALAVPPTPYLQLNISLNTANSSLTPVLSLLEIDFVYYSNTGSIITPKFGPDRNVAEWGTFYVNASLAPGTSASYEYSGDRSQWYPIIPGQIPSLPTNSAITFRVLLLTVNTSLTPDVLQLSLVVGYRDAVDSVSVTPSDSRVTADDLIQLTATARDKWGWDIPWAVFTWSTDILGDNISSTGLYNPRSAGLRTVTACVVDMPTFCGSAQVEVLPGALSRILLTPPLLNVSAGETVSIGAQGFDFDGNTVALRGTNWTTDMGYFEFKSDNSVTFRAQGVAGIGVVRARVGAVEGTIRVSVSEGGIPVFSGHIPDQIADEDSPPWTLDLSDYARNQPDKNDSLDRLRWMMTGKNSSLFSVVGENKLGVHNLTFVPVPNAFGTARVVLWLVDDSGAKRGQELNVTLRPVNDPPYLYRPPDLIIAAGVSYTFDYLPYVTDVDNPLSDLSLSTSDPVHATVSGLKMNYAYGPEYLGKTQVLTLTVSDGKASSSILTSIKISDNQPPVVQSLFPSKRFQEDTYISDAVGVAVENFFYDPEGQSLNFSSRSQHVKVNWFGAAPDRRFGLSSDRDWVGAELVTIRATDKQGAFAETSFVVTVTPVNDPPVLAWREDVDVRFDVPYFLDLSLYVSDVDNRIEDLTLSTNEAAFVAVSEHTLILLFPSNVFGTAPFSKSLTIFLSDGQFTVSQRIYVHITGNAPPAKMPGWVLPDVVMREDTLLVGVFNLSHYFYDPLPEGKPLLFAAFGRHVTAAVDNKFMISLSPEPDWNGIETIKVRATDDQGAYIFDQFTVRVTPVNDPPRLFLPAQLNVTFGRDSILDLSQYVYDPDNNVTELSITTDDRNATVVGYAILIRAEESKDREVTIWVSDSESTNSTKLLVHVLGGPEPTSLWAQLWMPWSLAPIAAAGVGAFLFWSRYLRVPYTVEDVFLIGKEGRLIMHNTRRLRADRDEDILAGMLTAIMSFVKDSFREENEELKRFEFGNRRVVVERGEDVILACIYGDGQPTWAFESMKALISDIESRYGNLIANWSGDVEDLKGLKQMMDTFVLKKRYSEGDWKSFARGPRKPTL